MIPILYADEQIVFIDKPHDLLSVPGKGPEHRDCVIERVLKGFPTARVVHRLDCATSGVMVLALDADSHRHLSRQFHDRKTRKRYLADIYGSPSVTEGQCDQPLRCDWPNRPKQMVDWGQGKNALTYWRVLQRFSTHTRVELTPITGRSHQLRVHMQSMGHPILGDRFYASGDALAAANRLHLHAAALQIFHPISGDPLLIESPCPF